MMAISSFLFNLKGYIIQKSEKKPSVAPGKPGEQLLTYVSLSFQKKSAVSVHYI